MHLSFAPKELVFHITSYSYETHLSAIFVRQLSWNGKIIENQLCQPRMQPFKRGARHKRKKYNAKSYDT